MTSKEITTALIEWAMASAPDLASAYDYAPKERDLALPAVDALIDKIEYVDQVEDAGPEIQQVQQITGRVYRCTLVMCVDPEPVQDAADQLGSFCDALGAAALADKTLGGRVPRIADAFDFDFELPFATFDDGTEGRVATMHLVVADPIPVP